MPRSEAQFEEIRRSRREMILDTSLRLFSNQGYNQTSIDQIAKAAKISKGLIYNYYTSKAELLEAIVKNGFNQIENLMQPPSGDLAPQEILSVEIHRIFQAVTDDPVFWRLYYSLIMRPVVFDQFREMLTQLHSEQFQFLESLFDQQGVNNPRYEALLFGAAIDGIFFHFLMNQENYPLTEMRDFLLGKYCTPD